MIKILRFFYEPPLKPSPRQHPVHWVTCVILSRFQRIFFAKLAEKGKLDVPFTQNLPSGNNWADQSIQKMVPSFRTRDEFWKPPPPKPCPFKCRLSGSTSLSWKQGQDPCLAKTQIGRLLGRLWFLFPVLEIRNAS